MLLGHAGETVEFLAIARRRNHQCALMLDAADALLPPRGGVLPNSDNIARRAFGFTPRRQHAASKPRCRAARVIVNHLNVFTAFRQ
jgi:hypothetical protein